MRDDLQVAVSELYQGIRHEHWYGKTYRQFWMWFNDRCFQIVGGADGADLDELEIELLEVRAAADDAGYAMPPGRLDDTIEPPM